MKIVLGVLLFSSVFFITAGHGCDEHGVTGIMVENDLHIGPYDKNISNVTESEFMEVIDRVTAIYQSDFKDRSMTLQIKGDWEDGSVNAYAQRKGRMAFVNMFGGMARHHAINKDSFALVVCHELGHHIGGVPKKLSRAGNMYGNYGEKVYSWASNEGQADYFASMKCLRRYLDQEDNIRDIKNKSIPSFVRISCQNQFNMASDVAICIRSALAGYSLANLFNSVRGRWAPLSFENKDPSKVLKTYDKHPAPQCRLDTYFSGALCDKEVSDEVSDTEQDKGVCSRKEGYVVGARPLCWFRPYYQ